jgi:hypothetical protein
LRDDDRKIDYFVMHASGSWGAPEWLADLTDEVRCVTSFAVRAVAGMLVC